MVRTIIPVRGRRRFRFLVRVRMSFFLWGGGGGDGAFSMGGGGGEVSGSLLHLKICARMQGLSWALLAV